MVAVWPSALAVETCNEGAQRPPDCVLTPNQTRCALGAGWVKPMVGPVAVKSTATAAEAPGFPATSLAEAVRWWVPEWTSEMAMEVELPVACAVPTTPSMSEVTAMVWPDSSELPVWTVTGVTAGGTESTSEGGTLSINTVRPRLLTTLPYGSLTCT